MGVSYNDFISAITNYYNAQSGISPAESWGSGATWTSISRDMANVGVNTDTYVNYLENFPELFEITRNADGTILDSSLKKYMYYGNVDSYNPSTGGSPNSNNVPSTIGNSTGINIPAITNVSTTGQFSVTGGIGLKTDTGVTVQGVAQTIGASVAAVATGATLGKIIGDGLYEANPEIWSNPSLSALSKTDWNKFITTVKDDVGTVVNEGVLALWGVDGDKSTMYIDENAMAYMTWYMNQNNMLALSKNADIDDRSGLNLSNIILPFRVNSGYVHGVFQNVDRTYESTSEIGVNVLYNKNNNNDYELVIFASENPFHVTIKWGTWWNFNYDIETSTTFNGKTFYVYSDDTWFYRHNMQSIDQPTNDWRNGLVAGKPDINTIAYIMLYGTLTEGSEINGVNLNDNSKQFDPTGVGSVTTALGALKNQYPELWNNSITRNTVQDDGSEDTRVYVPLPVPKYINPFDTQPTTGTPSQTNPSIDPNTTPKEEQDSMSESATKDPTQSDNPNTGGGNSPTVVVPTQQASALWAIYNPSLSELNSLGAWLWSTNFIDQILKIFNDPMQAIIGLHKVYATPSISGTGNIKVGYLDSGVSSKIVGNQYTYIDCGTVSLREYYGNILDYSPYTDVKLYLPFIGIVPLDIADVSRASISIRYGVDVLTGACLASVSVQRDAAGGVLYQYSGNCACQYPLSSGSYMGMVTGAIGAVGSLAKGNIFGGMLGIAGMHTNIEHSGGFSGNAGAMGIKKPYLIISRPQSQMNDGFPSIQGYPSNAYVSLNSCTGFTQVLDCHVENVPATDKELDMISSLLKEGVII